MLISFKAFSQEQIKPKPEFQLIFDTSLMTFGTNNNKDWKAVGYADMQFKFTYKSEKIRAEITPEIEMYGTDIEATMKRAFIRANLHENFRLTVGKIPTSWGEGSYYNTGDLLYSSSANAGFMDLREDTIRDNARWLTNFYVPFNQYGFIEALYAAPNTSLKNLTTDPGSFDIADSAGGGRILFKAGDAQIQTGVMYDGSRDTVGMSFNVSGGIADFVDVYFGTRFEVDPSNPNTEDIAYSNEYSLGFSLPYTFTSGQFLSVKLETVFRPWRYWKSTNNTMTDRDTEAGDQYGNEIFFEVLYTPVILFTWMNRVIIQPIDGSAQFFTSFIFNPIQDLSIYMQLLAEAGSPNDKYSYANDGGVYVGLGLKYVL